MVSGSSRRRVEGEPAFVLHSYPYRETSLIVETFTRGHGRIALLAKGARRPRSALRGVLLAFHPLQLSWSGASELATLTGAEWSGGQRTLAGTGLMCGFYLNELLLRLLPREDPHEGLFDTYASSLARLGAGAESGAAVLRCFERRMLGELGYALLLEQEAQSGAPIQAQRRYVYEPERGPLLAQDGADAAYTVSGRTLLEVARDDYTRAETREEARILMRNLIANRLGGQPLHTRSVLAELQEL